MVIKQSIESFLNGELICIDARSPAEYAHAHIPGALNIPLLNDHERHEVGLCYREKGHYEAVALGYRFIGPQFEEKLRELWKAGEGKAIRIYCYRGGLRSSILAEMAQHAGMRVYQLQGGYKAFRHWALQSFDNLRKVCVLGGKTGSGKTRFLHRIQTLGEQVIDLESLAGHRGSAFGQIGLMEQPTLEHFQNRLAIAWYQTNPEKPVWLEDESRMIGKINLPEAIYKVIRESQVWYLEVPTEVRIQNIVSEYGSLNKVELEDATLRIKKRLGDERCKIALEALNSGELEIWAAEVLAYYDKTYEHGLSKRPKTNVSFFSENELWEYIKKGLR